MSALPTLSFPFLALSVACFRTSSTFCPESKLARAVIAVLFYAGASFARRRALMLGALVQHVPLGKPLFRSVLPDLVGMNVLTPVDPGPPPGGVVDDHYVRVPIKAAIAPAPRAEEFSDGYEEVKADRAADHDSGLRREENNRRVIVRHRDVGRMHGHNRDVRPIADDDLGVAAQISVVLGLPALSLNRIHHVLLVRQERVAKIGGPTHVVGHHFKH